MIVIVEVHHYLKKSGDVNAYDLDLPEGKKVFDVINSLSLRPGEVWLSVVNGELVEKDHLLHDGDRLSLYPPIGGGNEN